MSRGVTFAIALASVSLLPSAQALTLDLEKAVALALENDPRIRESGARLDFARAQKQEAEGADDISVSMTTFLGGAPKMEGGFFEQECGDAQTCVVRDDRYSVDDGFSPWAYLQMRVIKPLYTFGKVENFRDAATANIEVKKQDVRLQKGRTVLDVKRAYFGYLASRDGRLFLEDVKSRVESAENLVAGWLEEDEGKAKQSDLYALRAARDLVGSYVAQMRARENTAMAGLRFLTGIGDEEPLEPVDKRLSPLELPADSLSELRGRALQQRPEMSQVEQGLKGYRALVEANRAMARPNLFMGVGGFWSRTPGRDRINNPYITDDFNDYGATPMIGLNWEWETGRQAAQVAQSRAELNVLVEKASLARQGIPFEVAEQYFNVTEGYASVNALRDGAKSARRWMIASYADFEAGLESADKVVTAFQGYVLAYGQYLEQVFEYNMQVARLQFVVGDYQ